MTAHRARSLSRRHQPAQKRALPTLPAHLHPNWLPPGGYAPDGAFLDPAALDQIGTPSAGLPREFNSRAGSLTTPFPTELPAGLHPAACPTTTPVPAAPVPAAPTAAAPASPASAPSYGALPWFPGSAAPPPDPDGPHAEEEDAIFRNRRIPGDGSEIRLSHTALPLRHQIYALHCQGRSLSAIARSLRLDRGTVARHLHAVEALLLAEQTDDLARLRLRAIEAQHAILAACWDALLCEELLESDEDNPRPYPPHRAQLLATAARAARTAAQLQGLFTPAALQAALQATVAPPAATCGNLRHACFHISICPC